MYMPTHLQKSSDKSFRRYPVNPSDLIPLNIQTWPINALDFYVDMHFSLDIM